MRAIERKAQKLRAKGITVDVEVLKSDYISQHRGQNFNFSDSDEDEDPIDVVGVAEDSIEPKVLHGISSKSNPFSIDSLLNLKSSWLSFYFVNLFNVQDKIFPRDFQDFCLGKELEFIWLRIKIFIYTDL